MLLETGHCYGVCKRWQILTFLCIITCLFQVDLGFLIHLVLDLVFYLDCSLKVAELLFPVLASVCSVSLCRCFESDLCVWEWEVILSLSNNTLDHKHWLTSSTRSERSLFAMSGSCLPWHNAPTHPEALLQPLSLIILPSIWYCLNMWKITEKIFAKHNIPGFDSCSVEFTGSCCINSYGDMIGKQQLVSFSQHILCLVLFCENLFDGQPFSALE